MDCEDPGVPPHCSRWLTNTFFGSKVKYNCNKGFVLSGSRIRICQLNGTWSGSLPTCTGELCPHSTPLQYSMHYKSDPLMLHVLCNYQPKYIGGAIINRSRFTLIQGMGSNRLTMGAWGPSLNFFSKKRPGRKKSCTIFNPSAPPNFNI